MDDFWMFLIMAASMFPILFGNSRADRCCRRRLAQAHARDDNSPT